MQPVTHTDGQLVDSWLRPFVLGLHVVDEARGQVCESEGFWEKTNIRVRSEPAPRGSPRAPHTDRLALQRCSSRSRALAACSPGSREGEESPGERRAARWDCLGLTLRGRPRTDRQKSLHPPPAWTRLRQDTATPSFFIYQLCCSPH